MPARYSDDLRWRVVWRYFLQRKSVRAICREMYIGKRTAHRYIKLYDTTGEVSSKIQSHHGPLPGMSEFELATILQMLFTEPTTYLSEIQEELKRVTGYSYHIATIHRAMKRLGISRKTVQRIARQRCTIQRAHYLSEIMAFDPKTLVLMMKQGQHAGMPYEGMATLS